MRDPNLVMMNSKSNQTIRWQRVNLVLAVYSLLVSAGALGVVLTLLQAPADRENNILLGLSLQRLILISGISLVCILNAFIAVRAYRNRIWAEQIWTSLFSREAVTTGIILGAAVGILLSWLIAFTPAYRFGDYQGYAVRLSPILFFFLFVSMLTFIVAWTERYGLQAFSFMDTLRAQKQVLLIALITMIVFILIWFFIVMTGLGVSVTDGFWYIAGVPILGLQIILAFAIGISIFFLERSSLADHLPRQPDIFVFFLIWGVAAFLWVREPLPPSFFAPGPYAPNFEYHPFSDAATFDIGSQFALIGQGINNGVFFDRALYMAFLVYLHVFAGQNYIQIVAIQAAIYAVFPAILYLLGKAVHSRSFGVILAATVTLRGINGIAASTMIDLSNQKQLLTDFPTVIFVALVALMIVKWIKSPAKNYLYILWVGGVVGLGVMLRTNLLFLVLFTGILIVFIYWRQRIQGVTLGLLLVITMFAGTFAWGAYHDKSVFDVYLYRIRLVIDARYPGPATPVPASPQGNESPLIISASASKNREVASLNPVFDVMPMSQPLVIDNMDDTGGRSIFYFVTTHFLHNMVMSVFVLPASPVFHDLWNTVKVAFPFWEFYWDGNMTAGDGFFLLINLFLISLGVGAGWRLSKFSGLVPLGVFLFYNLANAFARTSGGRYLVPTDWIVIFYYALGLFQIVLWGIHFFGLPTDFFMEQTAEGVVIPARWTWAPLKNAPWIILFFLFAGSLVPLSENLFPARYAVRSQSEQLDALEQGGYLQEMGFDRSALASFSEQWPDFRIVYGRALYPRFFTENRGLPKNQYPYSILGFPRIAFTMIGPEGMNYVLLPESDVPFFPNASDVIVLGCQEGANLDALAVVVIKEQIVVYLRQPASTLQCPLREPVCDNNHVCR